MNKICITIEQSKKLIELGLDTKTADMCYIKREINDTYIEVPIVKPIGEASNLLFAWSLSVLLELMPNITQNYNGINVEYYPRISLRTKTITYNNPKQVGDYKSISNKCLLDAAFEMICWLLENDKI